MNTIVRNFMSVVRRFKLATVLNVLGLSVAFVAFMLIMMQVSYDNRFDSCQPKAERIFRFDLGNSTGQQAVIARPLARIFTESSPHIKAGCIVSCFMQDYFFSVKRNEERVNFMEKWWFASPEIMQVFDFKMLEGDDKALMEPNSCILPESLARKFFGNESAIGQQLIDQSGKAVTVKGVFRDFPLNSTLSNVVYVPLPEKQDYDSWSNFSYLSFVRLDDASNKELVLENFKKNEEVNKALSNIWEGYGLEDFILTSLPELHFNNNIQFDTLPKANRQTLLVLSSIAIVILVIAGINFTNFSTSLAPMRLYELQHVARADAPPEHQHAEGAGQHERDAAHGVVRRGGRYQLGGLPRFALSVVCGKADTDCLAYRRGGVVCRTVGRDSAGWCDSHRCGVAGGAVPGIFCTRHIT